jgi:hypothetical protein
MAIADALSGLTQPTMQEVAMPQMNAPEVQFEENKSKWRNFLATLEDPNVRQALIATGIGLMRSPGYGQNSGDIIANALSSGVGTLQGLRNMQYERQTKEDQRRQENRRADAALQNQTTQVQQQGQQIQNAQAQAQTRTELERAQLSEAQRHNLSTEEIARQNAESDRIRAQAYRTQANTGRNLGQDVFKIEALTQQYKAEGMDETAARAKAVMVVESTGAARTPGEQAQKLYELKLKNWQQDINNFGKSLTMQQMQKMLQESMNEVFQFHNFSANLTGQPPTANPNNPRAGVIDRSGGSPVGTKKQFGGSSPGTYEKIKAGPDSDQSTWRKVTDGNAR